MTAVPISILLRARADGREQRERRAELAGEVVHAEVGAVGAQLLGGHGQLDRLSSASAPCRTCECGDGVQCPNDRNPIFFTARCYRPTVTPRGGPSEDRVRPRSTFAQHRLAGPPGQAIRRDPTGRPRPGYRRRLRAAMAIGRPGRVRRGQCPGGGSDGLAHGGRVPHHQQAADTVADKLAASTPARQPSARTTGSAARRAAARTAAPSARRGGPSRPSGRGRSRRGPDGRPAPRVRAAPPRVQRREQRLAHRPGSGRGSAGRSPGTCAPRGHTRAPPQLRGSPRGSAEQCQPHRGNVGLRIPDALETAACDRPASSRMRRTPVPSPRRSSRCFVRNCRWLIVVIAASERNRPQRPLIADLRGHSRRDVDT